MSYCITRVMRNILSYSSHKVDGESVLSDEWDNTLVYRACLPEQKKNEENGR